MLCILVSASSVLADVTVLGDLPGDALTYGIYAYDTGSQSGPCTGTPDGGSSLFASATGSGDLSYNDNDDYSLTVSGLAASDTIFMYFCGGSIPGDLAVQYTKNVSDNTNYTIDMGKVKATSLHTDLNSDNVDVCVSTSQISSETGRSVSSAQYSQWCVVDANFAITQAEVYLDTDGSDLCVFDATKSPGRYINVTSANSYNNFGVFPTFTPDTLATGDLHTDLNNTQIEVFDNNGDNVGLSYVSAAACLNDANDDYALCYEDNTFSPLTVYLNPAVGNPTVITSVAGGFTVLDAVTKVSGTVPTDDTSVEFITGGLEYSTDVNASGDYALFIPDGVTSNITFYRGSDVLFDNELVIPAQNATCGMDIVIDLAKYNGTTHNDLKTGYTIDVFSNSSFVNKLSGNNYTCSYDNVSNYYVVTGLRYSALGEYTVAIPGSGGSGGGGGGGSSSAPIGSTAVICREDWICDVWSTCDDGTQTRDCFDGNSCGTSTGKPIESQSCTMPEVIEEDNRGDADVVNATPAPAPVVDEGDLVTGLFTFDNIKSNPFIASLVALLVLALLYGGYFYLFKKKDNNQAE